MTMISLVVPVYNEAATLAENLGTMLAQAAGEDYVLELVAVDDGSHDGSGQCLAALAVTEARLRPLYFTRNFGKEAAIVAGLAAARGEAVVVLDADLQHPPARVAEMVALWRGGARVVHAVKQQRQRESMGARWSARLFYALFRRFSGLQLAGHSDFKLLDRSVVATYLALPERRHFFRGLIAWGQWPSALLPFEVAIRSGQGGSRWSRLRLLGYALDNLTSFSALPLRLVSWLGGATLVLGAVIGTLTLVQKAQGVAVNGFTTVNLLIILTSGAVMLSLGVIGHYLARIYEELKQRPLYLTRNMPQQEEK